MNFAKVSGIEPAETVFGRRRPPHSDQGVFPPVLQFRAVNEPGCVELGLARVGVCRALNGKKLREPAARCDKHVSSTTVYAVELISPTNPHEEWQRNHRRSRVASVFPTESEQVNARAYMMRT